MRYFVSRSSDLAGLQREQFFTPSSVLVEEWDERFTDDPCLLEMADVPDDIADSHGMPMLGFFYVKV